MPTTIAPPKKKLRNLTLKLKVPAAKQRSIVVARFDKDGLADPLPAAVAEISRKLAELQSELNALRTPEARKVILPELHDGQSGRIDAAKVAEFMGVPLKRLADGLGLNYKAVHRHPAAAGFQEALRPVKRSLELLHEFFGAPESIRIWLNTPHPDLAQATALDTILGGKAFAVALILENAWNGVPV
ncbi:MAG: hypothetical protein RL376_518 [Verrucomicrobiota bacterium]|jgi:hypothetical protein